MASIGDWDEIIESAAADCFVGRKQELEMFRQDIHRHPPRFLIFYIMGQAGVGKTTLLNYYREIAKEAGFVLADCDEHQQDVPAVLGRFAHQLAEQDITLKLFSEQYKIYRQKMHEIENDPEAPRGLASLIGRTVVRIAYVGGDLLPGVRKGLEYLPRETVETQASEWATYLAKKFTSKDEKMLVREPTEVLTPLFIKDLNEAVKTKNRRILLCLENFEATRQELQEWLLRLPEYKLSQHIRLAIAGRDRPGVTWERLRKVTLPMSLDIFTEQEAETFLNTNNIMDANRRRAIVECSGRLPVLMSWLSVPEGQEADPAVPTHDIVERFLRWVSEASFRQAALLAAIPRSFNLDILLMLVNNSHQSMDVQAAFNWLLSMPFVQQRSDGWQYHSVVRRMILRYQKQRSPQAYQQMHTVLADFYHAQCQELSSSIEEVWSNEAWRVCTLAYSYHLLAAEPVQHWNEVVNLFTVARRRRRSFAVEIIELLHAKDMLDELAHNQIEIVDLFGKQVQAVENGDLQDGFVLFDMLCTTSNLSPQAKCYAFAYRGETYRVMERYEEALADFDRAIALNNVSDWSHYQKALVYLMTERMQRSEDALSSAMELAQARLSDNSDNTTISFNFALYSLVGGKPLAVESYEKLIATCSSITILQGASDDLDDLLAIQPSNEPALHMRLQLQESMERLKRLPTENGSSLS